jgi:hypothetical protein
MSYPRIPEDCGRQWGKQLWSTWADLLSFIARDDIGAPAVYVEPARVLQNALALDQLTVHSLSIQEDIFAVPCNRGNISIGKIVIHGLCLIE